MGWLPATCLTPVWYNQSEHRAEMSLSLLTLQELENGKELEEGIDGQVWVGGDGMVISWCGVAAHNSSTCPTPV